MYGRIGQLVINSSIVGTAQSLAMLKFCLINNILYKIRSRTITTIQNNKTDKQK